MPRDREARFFTGLFERSQRSEKVLVSALAAVPPRLADWAMESFGATPTFYLLPRRHHKHLNRTDLAERLTT